MGCHGIAPGIYPRCISLREPQPAPLDFGNLVLQTPPEVIQAVYDFMQHTKINIMTEAKKKAVEAKIKSLTKANEQAQKTFTKQADALTKKIAPLTKKRDAILAKANTTYNKFKESLAKLQPAETLTVKKAEQVGKSELDKTFAEEPGLVKAAKKKQK